MTLLEAKATLERSSQAMEAVFWPDFSFLKDYIPLFPLHPQKTDYTPQGEKVLTIYLWYATLFLCHR